MKRLSLYDIGKEAEALDQLAQMEAGEISPEMEELHKELEDIIANKTDSLVQYVQRLEDEIAAGKERIKAMQQFVSYRSSAIERIKEYLRAFFEQTGKAAFTGDFFKVSKVKGRSMLAINSEEHIPLDYIKTVTSIDKTQLLKDVKAGTKVEGVALTETTPSIRFTARPVKAGTKGE